MKIRQWLALTLASVLVLTSLPVNAQKAYASELPALEEAQEVEDLGTALEEVSQSEELVETDETSQDSTDADSAVQDNADEIYVINEPADEASNEIIDDTAETVEESTDASEEITVSFDANQGVFSDGETVSVITVNKGELLPTLPMNPEMGDGSFVFTGWYYEPEALNIVDLSTFTADAAVTLYAGYAAEVEKDEESVLLDEGLMILNANGGVFPNGKEIYRRDYVSQYMSYDEDCIPTREGHIFTGWYADKECKNFLSNQYNLYDLEDDPESGITIYAGWTNNFHKITYVFTGDKAPYDTAYYWEGQESGRSYDPITYYVPDGSSLGEYYYYPSGSFRNTDLHYATGKWYTNPERTEHKKDEDDYYYYDDDDEKESFYRYDLAKLVPDKDMTFYLEYTKRNSVITLKSKDETAYFKYENNNEEISGKYESCDYFFDDYYSSGETIYLENFDRRIENTDPRRKLIGWYLDEACTQKIEADEYGRGRFKGDSTIYALYDSSYKAVTLDANGGYFIDSDSKQKLDYQPAFTIKSSEKAYYGDWHYVVKNPDVHKVLKGWSVSETATTATYGEESDSGSCTFNAALDPSKDITLYAVWGDKFNTITLDGKGGALTCDYDGVSAGTDKYVIRAKKGDDFWITEYNYTISKDGYAFDGWFYDTAYTKPIADEGKVTCEGNDITLHAKWANKHNVVFDFGAGTVGGEKSYTLSVKEGSTIRNDKLSVPENPTPDSPDQAFVGWYEDANFSKKIDRSEILDLAINSKKTFYAKYANAYDITFNANGGKFASVSTGQTYTVKVAEGETLKGKYPTVKSTENKVFRGWFSDQAATTEVKNLYDFVVTATGPKTFYAGYTECYTLEFHANATGAVFDNGKDVVTVKVTKGDAYRYGNDDSAKDVLFKAPNLNYSSVTGKKPLKYGYDGSETLAWCLNPEGRGNRYYFGSYFKFCNDENEKRLYDFNMYGFVPTGNMKFYVKWGDEVSVTFDANGGSFKDDEDLDRYGELSKDGTTRTLKVAMGTPYYRLYEPYGYVMYSPKGKSGDFEVEWYADKACTTKPTGNIDDNMTVYAKYIYSSGGSSSGGGGSTSKKLTLNAGDGYFDNVTQKTKTMNYTVGKNSYVTVDIPKTDNTGAAFVCWCTDAALKTPYDQSNQWIKDGRSYIATPKEVKNLYAKFAKTAIVTLNANGGYFDADASRTKDPDEALREDTLISVKSNPVGYGIKISDYNKRIRRDGNLVFDGWSYDSAGNNKATTIFYDDSETEYFVSSENVTLYANWVEYELPTSIEVNYGDEIQLELGETVQLQATVKPESTTKKKKLHWYLQDVWWYNNTNPLYKPPVTLTDDGLLTAITPGEGEIYAELNGVYSEKVRFRVLNTKRPDSITLDKTELNLVKNDTATVTATVTSSSASTVTWSSSNADIATVTKEGATAIITAGEKEGTATITATSGKLKATVTVNVSVPIKLDKNDLILTSMEGVKEALTAKVSGKELKNKEIAWTVSDPALTVTPGTGDASNTATIVPASDLDTEKTVTVTATIKKDEQTSYSDFCTVVIRPQDTVIAPVSDISAGAVKKGTRIHLSSESYQPDIYYTEDGSAPVIGGAKTTKYDPDGIVIDSNVTIKAIAVKEGYRNSAVSEFAYTIANDQWGDITDDEVKALFHENSSEVPSGMWFLVGDKTKYYEAGVNAVPTDYKAVYTGKNITFNDSIFVYQGTDRLVENRDYTVKFANNKVAAANNAAKAPTVNITGKGNYSKKAAFTFTISPANIENAELDALFSNVAIGPRVKLSSVKPGVTYNGMKLALNKDYKLWYLRVNPDGQTATAVNDPDKEFLSKTGTDYFVIPIAIEGSNFTGTMANVDKKMWITLFDPKTEKQLSKLKLVDANGKAAKVPYKENGAAYTEAELFDNSKGQALLYLRDGKTDLVYGTDYEVRTIDEDLASAGKHNVTLISKNNSYTGFFETTFEVTGVPMKSVKVAGLNKTVEYTGKKIELNNDLFNPADKTVISHNNSSAEKWTGVTLYYTHKVNGVNVTTTLKENVDYVPEYSNTGALGKFTLTFTGIGQYDGVLSFPITVKAFDLKKNNAGKFTVKADDAVFVKSGAKPAVTVEFDGKELKEGVDYTLTYKNTAKAVLDYSALAAKNRPTVTVKGKGNYSGTNATKYFNIAKAPVTNIVLTANDLAYNAKGKNGYFKLIPKLMDDGKAVAAGKNKDVDSIAKGAYRYYYAEAATMLDGTVKYAGSPVLDTDKPLAGTRIRVEVTVTCPASSSYTAAAKGTAIEGYYRILDAGKDISKYKVKVLDPSKLTYAAGEDVRPLMADNLEVSYKANGAVVKLTSSEYEIVSVKNNKLVGTAQLTLRGRGQYGGVKTISFKVGAKSLN